MTSIVDICNLALSRLGDDATVASIDPPEGSAQAEHCARFYPVALDSLLELHPWKFCTRRATLASLDVDLFGWSYAYAEPAGAVRILKVLDADTKDDAHSEPFETSSGSDGALLIRTDLETATALYTVRVTDTTKFPPLVVDALGWLLASHLAGPIIKGNEGRTESKRCLQMFGGVIRQATMSDSGQRHTDPDHSPEWIAGR